MNKTNIFTRFGALAGAFLMAFSLGISPASAASNDIIDMSRTGSLSVYKYDLTAAEQGGVNVSQFTATGAKDTAAESALGKYALQGVQYDYLRAGDIMTYSDAGSVKVVYNVPNTLRSVLGLTNDEAVTHQGDTYYYTSDQYNDALADLLTDNTAGKDKLEAWVASAGAKHMAETDKNGKTSVSNLQLGLYMVIETKVPEEVYCTTDPFFVSIPMTDSIADNWFYDVSVYPKNQTNNPTLNKLVSENGTFGDTATVSEGDVIDYRLVSQLPTISSTATYLSQYTYEDVLSKGLTYNKDAVVSFYANKDDAENGTGTPIDVWTSKTNPTKDGFNEINKHYSDKFMEDSAVSRLWQEAMAYNQALLNNHVQLTDPFETVEQKMDAGVYSEMLSVDDSAIMTYIEIPKISVYLPVYHGTEPKTLEMGVGHLEGSSLPVGGDSTHCILSGHTGLNRAKIFTDLSELKAGDHFFLHTLGKTLAYEVDQILTVEPYDISNLQLEEGRDYVTLVTCTPYGVNSHRLLVRGTRTEYEPKTIKLETELAKDNPSNQSQWMREYQKALATGIALVLLVSVLGLTVERWRKHHANR